MVSSDLLVISQILAKSGGKLVIVGESLWLLPDVCDHKMSNKPNEMAI